MQRLRDSFSEIGIRIIRLHGQQIRNEDGGVLTEPHREMHRSTTDTAIGILKCSPDDRNAARAEIGHPPNGKHSSMWLWILGELCHRIEEVGRLLRHLAESVNGKKPKLLALNIKRFDQHGAHFDVVS